MDRQDIFYEYKVLKDDMVVYHTWIQGSPLRYRIYEELNLNSIDDLEEIRETSRLKDIDDWFKFLQRICFMGFNIEYLGDTELLFNRWLQRQIRVDFSPPSI